MKTLDYLFVTFIFGTLVTMTIICGFIFYSTTDFVQNNSEYVGYIFIIFLLGSFITKVMIDNREEKVKKC